MDLVILVQQHQYQHVLILKMSLCSVVSPTFYSIIYNKLIIQLTIICTLNQLITRLLALDVVILLVLNAFLLQLHLLLPWPVLSAALTPPVQLLHLSLPVQSAVLAFPVQQLHPPVLTFPVQL